MPDNPSTHPEEDRLIDAIELQRRWKVSRGVLRRMIEDGRLSPPLMIGIATRRWWLHDIRLAEGRFTQGKGPIPVRAAAAKKAAAKRAAAKREQPGLISTAAGAD
jgi:hypothetical protein